MRVRGRVLTQGEHENRHVAGRHPAPRHASSQVTSHKSQAASRKQQPVVLYHRLLVWIPSFPLLLTLSWSGHPCPESHNSRASSHKSRASSHKGQASSHKWQLTALCVLLCSRLRFGGSSKLSFLYPKLAWAAVVRTARTSKV